MKKIPKHQQHYLELMLRYKHHLLNEGLTDRSIQSYVSSINTIQRDLKGINILGTACEIIEGNREMTDVEVRDFIMTIVQAVNPLESKQLRDRRSYLLKACTFCRNIINNT